jgi:hypothetical protein
MFCVSWRREVRMIEYCGTASDALKDDTRHIVSFSSSSLFRWKHHPIR